MLIENIDNSIKYLIKFLLGDDASPTQVAKVGYTANPEEYHKYKVVIKPSAFFQPDVYGTALSLPTLPLKIWEETPILFGEAKTEKIDNTTIIHADLIAATYFLVSRYEEMVRAEVRDVHGRFPGKESLPYRAGFIDRPIVEEYGKLLRDELRAVGCKISEPAGKIQKVYLTHDVDMLTHYRNVKNLIKGLLKGLRRPKEGRKALKSFFNGPKHDPWYTFPYLFNLDNSLRQKFEKRCEVIAFIKADRAKYKEDKPLAMVNGPDYKYFFRYCKKKKVTLGLHSSYEAGIYPWLIAEEKAKLQSATKVTIKYNRHHYLGIREVEDLQTLLDNGFSDDFTLGYADMAGFRLGTCRAIRWINPINGQLTDLKLHSLTMMDVTLSEKKYMYMNAYDAFHYCQQLIDCVEKYNGELNLLWHNTSVEKRPDSYHRKLYKDIIKYLLTKK